MLDFARAVHAAIGTESPRWFMAVFAIIGFVIFAFVGWIVDRGYQVNLKEQAEAHEPYYAKVKTDTGELGPESIVIVRHLELHGPMTFSPAGNSSLPDGMSASDARMWLDRCVSKHLVTKLPPVWKQTGGVQPIQEQTYRIAEGMEAAIKEFLHEGERPDPPSPSK